MDMTNSQNGSTTAAESNTSPKDQLKEFLRNGVLDIHFIKKDGTDRVMKCTLKPELLPVQTDLEEHTTNRKENPDVLAVWDVENEGWRSFRVDSVVGIMGFSHGN